MGSRCRDGCAADLGIPDGSWPVSLFPQNPSLSTCLLTSRRHLCSAGTGCARRAASWLLSPCCSLVAALALASASVPGVPSLGHCHAQKSGPGTSCCPVPTSLSLPFSPSPISTSQKGLTYIRSSECSKDLLCGWRPVPEPLCAKPGMILVGCSRTSS